VLGGNDFNFIVICGSGKEIYRQESFNFGADFEYIMHL
jgi:hypothetical protein